MALLEDALYEVTGRRLELVFATGERAEPDEAEPERPLSEEEIVELMKTTFDAQELELLATSAAPVAAPAAAGGEQHRSRDERGEHDE